MTGKLERLESRVLLAATSVNDDHIIGRAGEALFYASFEQSTGLEPTFIRSTGTTGILLKDIRPGSKGSNPQFVAEVGDVLFFSADDGNGPALWRTGGNIKTTKVAAVAPNTSSRAAAIGGTLYFAGGDAQHPHALWKTDGTPGSITQIKDFSADPQELTVFNNKVWFVATQNPLGSSLWQSDGTADGTTPTGLSGYAVAKPFAVTDDHLFYLDFRADQNKSHLWAVGKDSSTGLMHTTDGPDTIRDLTAKADSAYFVATDSQKHRDSLFRSTGLFFQEKRLRNFDDHGTIVTRDHSSPGSDRLYVEESNASTNRTGLLSLTDNSVIAITKPGPEEFPQLKQIGGDLYFARTVPDGQQLWHSNGTAGGTMRIKRFTGVPFLGGFTAFGSNVLFTASNKPFYNGDQPIPRTSVLWTTDGTASGTEKIRSFTTGATLTLAHSVILGTRIYFTVVDDADGTLLWFTNGTRNGTGSPA